MSSTAFAERHLAAPLRDDKGVAVVVVDMNLGELQAPGAFESRQIGHVMKLLGSANDEIVAESQHGRKVSYIGKSSPRLLVCIAVVVVSMDTKPGGLSSHPMAGSNPP